MTRAISQDANAPGPIASASFGAPLASAVTARLVIQARRGWFTTRSPDFQAGFVESARRDTGRRAAMGSVPGAMLGMLVGGVVGGALMEPPG